MGKSSTGKDTVFKRLLEDKELGLTTLVPYTTRPIRDGETNGVEKLLPVLIEVDDGKRLERALQREMSQDSPKYEEMCRRYLADSEDFAEEKIREAEITKRFQNNEIEECLRNIKVYIEDSIR